MAECRAEDAAQAGKSPARHIPEGTLPGPVRSQGSVARCAIQKLVARAQRAATRLESAREQWRALHGLAVAPGQPVVSYVGYSLKEPWGEPRVVIGIDADEAEYLASWPSGMSSAADQPPGA